MTRLRMCCSLFLLPLLLAPLLFAGGESPYFPETGPGAIHQRALDLERPSVVMYIALQPGYEDLPLMCNLRMFSGVRTVVMYLTNGEATPDDLGDDVPVSIAAHRKEEAYRAVTLLGGNPYFLNLPDPGIVPGNEFLSAIWNRDTVLARMDRALRYFRPDVVILGGDRRGEELVSARHLLAKEFMLAAIGEGDSSTAQPGIHNSSAWKVANVFAETSQGPLNGSLDQQHTYWKKSSREIAREAAAYYASLRLQMPAWYAGGDRVYTSIKPRSTGTKLDLLRGIPTYGAPTRPLRATISRILRQKRGGLYAPRMEDVLRGIDSLDFVLGRPRVPPTPGDLRILSSWKNSLEGLRCALLGVSVKYAVSDTVIGMGELVTLRFGAVTPRVDSAGTLIFFPAARNHSWGINGSLDSQFRFSANREFQLLSTSNFDYSLPMTQFGVNQNTLWARFSFIIVHRDSVRSREFMYQGEVQFHGAPRRTWEVLTPVVRANDGEGVITRLINWSRDPYKGSLKLNDSLVAPVDHKVTLPEKGSVFLDTVRLQLMSPLRPADYPMHMNLSGGGSLPFVMRKFDVQVDSVAIVGVLSGLSTSPLQNALARIRVRSHKIDPADSSALASCTVIVLDRDMAETKPGGSNEQLLPWVRRGGTLVVFPPAGGKKLMEGLAGCGYGGAPQLPPNAAVAFDTSAALMTTPNHITRDDWASWVVARSMGPVVVPEEVASTAVVTAGGLPLVVTLRMGAGSIRMVGCDIVSQLMNIHPGAHRLLANLVQR
jgi:hypothetical protein